jgi:hypothetical protein
MILIEIYMQLGFFMMNIYIVIFGSIILRQDLPDDNVAVGNPFSQGHPKGITDHWMNELWQNSGYSGNM